MTSLKYPEQLEFSFLKELNEAEEKSLRALVDQLCTAKNIISKFTKLGVKEQNGEKDKEAKAHQDNRL